MSKIVISSPSYAVGGKRGIMKPDETGYYDACLGGINTVNTRGEVYVAGDVINVFSTSSQLYRRAQRGELNSEIGHPVREKGMSEAEFYNRALTIREDMVCSNIREITLDLSFGKDNPGKANSDAIAIRGKVIPAGPYADTVQRAIDNPYAQLAYSIRALTNRKVVNGVVYKEITMPITFDFVNSPGIPFATKDNSLSLESDLSVKDVFVDVDLMKEVITESLDSFGLESGEIEFREKVLEAVSKTNRKIEKNRKIFLW